MSSTPSFLLTLGGFLLVWSRRTFGWTLPGWIGFAAVLSYYIGQDYATVAQRDWQAPLLAVLGLLGLQSWPSRGWRIGSGVLFGLAFAIRPHVVLFVPAAVLAIAGEAPAGSSRWRWVSAERGGVVGGDGGRDPAGVPAATGRGPDRRFSGGRPQGELCEQLQPDLREQCHRGDSEVSSGWPAWRGRSLRRQNSGCMSRDGAFSSTAWPGTAGRPRGDSGATAGAGLAGRSGGGLAVCPAAPEAPRSTSPTRGISSGALSWRFCRGGPCSIGWRGDRRSGSCPRWSCSSSPCPARRSTGTHWRAFRPSPTLSQPGPPEHAPPGVLGHFAPLDGRSPYRWSDYRLALQYSSADDDARNVPGEPAPQRPLPRLQRAARSDLAVAGRVRGDLALVGRAGDGAGASPAPSTEAPSGTVAVWDPENTTFDARLRLDRIAPVLRRSYRPEARFGTIEIWRKR